MEKISTENFIMKAKEPQKEKKNVRVPKFLTVMLIPLKSEPDEPIVINIPSKFTRFIVTEGSTMVSYSPESELVQIITYGEVTLSDYSHSFILEILKKSKNVRYIHYEDKFYDFQEFLIKFEDLVKA